MTDSRRKIPGHNLSSDSEAPNQGDACEGGQINPADLSFEPSELETLPTPPADTPPDPFDPVSLRLTPDQSASLGVTRTILTIPIRKPGKSEFVRVRSDENYRLSTAVIELRDERGETFLVAPDLRAALIGESTLVIRLLFTVITRQNVLFLWPVKLPEPDGRTDEWSRSSLKAAQLAMKSWVRVQANMALGAYEVYQATGQLPEPEWPNMTFRELLRIAFKDRYISDLNHPILRRLRGEV